MVLMNLSVISPVLDEMSCRSPSPIFSLCGVFKQKKSLIISPRGARTISETTSLTTVISHIAEDTTSWRRNFSWPSPTQSFLFTLEKISRGNDAGQTPRDFITHWIKEKRKEYMCTESPSQWSRDQCWDWRTHWRTDETPAARDCRCLCSDHSN